MNRASDKTQPGMEIRFWGNSRPDFGRTGITQRWVNIPGTVHGGSGKLRASWRLNGSRPMSLPLGPDAPRLVAQGDFNLEIDVEQLRNGIHTVEVIAEDESGARRSNLLDFLFEAPSFSLPPMLDLRTDNCASVYEFGQPVDGDWRLGQDGARCRDIGYDRLLAFGDRSWTDYELLAEVTLHGFHIQHPGYPQVMGPGVGFLTRWTGHAADDQHPHVEWRPCGVLGWYRFGRDKADTVRDYRLCMTGGDTTPLNAGGLLAEDKSGFQIGHGIPYHFRMRVKSRREKTAHYSLRVWQADSPEPKEWNLQADGLFCENSAGSILFVCHHADASLKWLQVRPA